MNPLVSISAAIVRAESSAARLQNAYLHSLHVVGSAGRASQLASAKKADLTVVELREALAFVNELIELARDAEDGSGGCPCSTCARRREVLAKLEAAS